MKILINILRNILKLTISKKNKKIIKNNVNNAFSNFNNPEPCLEEVNSLIINSGLSNGFSPYLFKKAKEDVLKNQLQYQQKTVKIANNTKDKDIQSAIKQYNQPNRKKSINDSYKKSTSSINSSECVSKYF
jgi:hypothetical protein